MKKKQLEVLLYSVVGVAAMFLIVLAVNFIFGLAKKRIDLTQEKLYTLSQGTKAIIKTLDGEVEMRFYATQGDEMPVQLKTYAKHIEDLLSEYQQQGKGKINVKKLDPKPDSDAEDSARLDGVEGQMTQTGDAIYLGLSVSYLDQKVAVPFAPDREKLLEYDISRAIAKVANPTKPVVGVMTPLPMFGMPMNPMMARMGQQPQESWVIISELQRDFTVKQVPMTAEAIDDDIQVLIVAHPKDITDKSQYAIDQFIMRGGKLIAFLDGLSVVDSQSKPQQNPMMPNFGGGSSLEKLVKAWGLTFDTSKVVADLKFTSRFQRQGRPEAAPAVLSMNPEGIETNDVVTSQLDNLLIPFAGVFSGTPAAGLKQTVLLKSTTESQLVEGFMAQMGGEQITKDFKASGTQYPLAIRLAGKFKTAFPDGPPAADKKGDEDKNKEEKQEEKKEAPQIKESAKETAVILVGDSDILYDQFCVQVQNFFGQKIIIPRNANLTLVQNMVEQLGGDVNLIAMRSRATINRPFTVVETMKAQADANYRSKIKELEDSLRDTQQKINELQAKKDKNQRMIITPEQQAEIEKFRKKEAEAKIELKALRKNLRREIDALENRLKVVNIAGMPIVVTLFGIGLAIFKQKRAKAR